MKYVIIPAAVRKGYEQSATCRILTCDSLAAGTTSLFTDMTQQHARISCENLPVPLKLENLIIS